MVVAVAALSSCDKGEGYATDFQYNMVTFIGSDTDGMEYEYQGYDDSPIIKLHDSEQIILSAKIGERVMLQYTELGMVDGVQQISTIGYSPTINDMLRMADIEDINRVIKSPIILNSIWRTGNYINMNCQLLYTGAARQYQLVMDKSTATAETVECYLIDNTINANTYYYRKAYAAFNIEAVWSAPSCRKVRIHTFEDKLGDRYYDFVKE